MAKVNFITTTELKQNSGCEFNVDDSKLNPFIRKSQDMYIGGALNSDFYQHLMDAKIANTLTADEITLIDDYIKPALYEWSLLEAFSNLTVKTTNQGNNQEVSQYSVIADNLRYKERKQEIRDVAEFYTKRLNKYLCDYQELYPLYLNPGDKVNQMRNTTSYFSGIHIKKGGYCNRPDDQYRNR